MEPLLPSLHNLPVFYTVVITLLVMVGLSVYALCRQLRHRPSGPGFAWTKGLILLPLWLLLLIWCGLAVTMGVFAGGMTGSLFFPLLGLGVVPVFALLTWGLMYWIRGSMLAYGSVLLLVPAFMLAVYTLQPLWICEPLAWSGLGIGQLCTARLYEHGDGGAIRDEGAARDWYRLAAAQGVAEAEYEVARFTRDREQQIAWYTRAADHDHAGAAYQLYWLLEQTEPQTAVQRLQAAVRQGHAGAQYRMGLLYRDAYGGVQRDLQRTRELWVRAAGGGYISAMRSLAIAYAEDGILFDFDQESSHHWEQQAIALAQSKPEIPRIEQALEWNWERVLQEVRARHGRAEAGDAAAQLEIGREILRQADTDPALIEKAYAWLERAAESGAVEAQYQLANHYLDSEPAHEAARVQGRRWLIAAADGGHEPALRKLITAFKEQSYGFPRDLQRSRAYSEALFRQLKARGTLENEPDWMTASWEYSDTLKQIKREASRYLPPDELRRQSDASDPAARYHLAKELLSTRYAEGIDLMTASAAAGYPQAQYEMALSIRHRKRTGQEERQAIEWLAAAAESGHRGAMVDLGVVYLQGIKRIGLARDPYRAKLLFEQALRDRTDVVYEQHTGNGRSWQYTVESVNRWLAQIPEAVMRLDLNGLEADQRRQAIEQWYLREQQLLRAQIPAAEVEAQALLQRQLDEIEQQRNVLLSTDAAHPYAGSDRE
jgi:TPR repeat protein